MCLADQPEIRQIMRKQRTSIFDILHQAFTDTQPEPKTQPEVRDKLVQLAEQLIECLLVEPFVPQQAEGLGVSLAHVCHDDLEVLGTVQGLLALGLIQGLPSDQIIALQPRLSTLLSYLAIGFYRQSCKSPLKASESRLNSILSSMADLVFVFDSEGRFIFHHSPQMDDLNIPPEAFLGKTHSEVMPSRIQTPFAEAMGKNRCGEVAQYEYWLEIDSKIRWFSSKMSPVFIDGDYTGSVAVAREITAIKEMQSELQQTHKTLERQAKRRTARLKVLHEIDQAILAMRPPKAIAEIALHHVQRLVPCFGGIVSLFEPESGDTIVLAAKIDDEYVVQEEVRLPITAFNGTGGLIESLQHRRVHALEDTFAIPQSSQTIQALRRWHIHSLLSVPLVVGNESIGALSIGMEKPGPFVPEYVDIAEEIAESLAIGIQQSRLMEQMNVSRSRLRRLTQQLISTQEEARRRLARALHDEAGQALIALRISLGLIQEDVPAEFEQLRQRLDDAIALTTATMSRIRSLAHDLRPPTLDAAGLRPALQGFCDEFSKHTRLHITYTSPEILPELSDAANICLYRFLQETLTNVAKHAEANRVDVVLCYDHNKVSLAVADDGHGFDEQARLSAPGWSMGIGLLGMQERLESLGGQLKIESQIGQGTCLTACLPVRGKSSEENR
jgi:PAS domain S-box-containing protein